MKERVDSALGYTQPAQTGSRPPEEHGCRVEEREEGKIVWTSLLEKMGEKKILLGLRPIR